MQRFMIVGGNRLQGTVRVSGSKNSSLPIVAASLLLDGECTVKGVPRLRDVAVMCEVLEHLGADVVWEKDSMHINARGVGCQDVSEDLMRRMRASNLVLGPLISRFKHARISYPGGCNIGSRPMNLHLKGLQALGVEITEKFGYITASAQKLQGSEVYLDMPSVGATENLIMAAIYARGATIIRNAAREPEIIDLQNFLNRMGAVVKGAGTDTIRITGVDKLSGTVHTVIPDRIEAGTHMVAAAITGGDVVIADVIPEHLEPVINKLRETGAHVEVKDDQVRVIADKRPRSVDIKTMPYPGFPTDMQPQFMALMTVAENTSVVTETVFENRYKHVMELRRMGADIRLEGQTAVIKGNPRLSGATVEASDLRAGAALVLAALAAEDGTVLERVEHIDRGYERLENKYNALGARIIRLNS